MDAIVAIIDAKFTEAWERGWNDFYRSQGWPVPYPEHDAKDVAATEK